MTIETTSEFLGNLSELIDKRMVSGGSSLEKQVEYLSTQAPNIIEWVTGVDYWNVPSTFRYFRQYQIIRDLFNLRCVNCNSQDPEAIDCWGKPRSYLESEVLLTWSNQYEDMVCPKCGNTFRQFTEDGLITPYNELICIAGMRSGKSFLGAHIGGYIEHVLRTMSMKGRGSIQRYLRQEKAEWFEVTFAASTATQARDTIYAKYKEMRSNSPWIQKHVAWIKEQEAQQLGVKDKWEYKVLDDSIVDGWMQVRFNRVSSNSAGIAGKTRIFAAIDELARLSNTDSKTSAQELYRVLNQSLKTVRSATDNYFLNPAFGYMLNVTSPISIDDMSMQIYNKTKPDTDESERLTRTYGWKGPTWEFNPEQRFDNFREEFIKDPVAAQRDFGADPPAAETPLFEDSIRFWKCIDYARQPIATFDTQYLTDKTGKQYIGAKVKDLSYNFVDQHYIFCDAGQTFDSFAIVCAHPVITGSDTYMDEATNPNAKNYIDNFPTTGQHVSQMDTHPDSPMAQGLSPNAPQRAHGHGDFERLTTVIDFCMRIIPTKERDIWFNSVLDIIKDLKVKIKIAAVCFDSWQSTSIIQSISDLGLQTYKVRLRSDQFFEFRSQVYNNQVSFLPPGVEDGLSLSENGTLQLKKTEEYMSGEGVGLVEMLKLERSSDLKRIVAPKKGLVRGRGSDDIANCIVGVNSIIKDSVVNKFDSGRKRDIRKRLMATAGSNQPKIFRPGG